MIEIKHRETGEVLHRVEAETLEGARLLGADLSHADLSHEDLTSAVLSGANLTGADLYFANLSHANLTGAILAHADFSFADLSGARLEGVLFYFTRLDWCDTLAAATGLERIRHYGPCSLDAATLRACIHDLPDVFLQGVGYTQREIDYLRSLYRQAIFFSCFISYARADVAFAQRLHNDLEAQDIPCWLDLHDLRGGDYWRDQIDRAIRLQDKLILVCSKDSLLRPNVLKEIESAIEAEKETARQKLFPIRLDDYIFSEEVTRQAQAARLAWVLNYVRAYHIPDFSNPANYLGEFGKLVQALQHPEKR